ncbi:MAG: hypothetical protein HC896_15145 [Bacteroidales bacterium]|nr:hypothetical protein [Bacteroidales bacterium]
MPEPPQRNVIAFQGSAGAYSDVSCRAVFPEMRTLPCASFEDTFAAVREHEADLAMIPIENSVAGRVADIHHLMPGGGLHIIGEHYQRVNHQLLGVPGATLDTVKTVRSHVQALEQCRGTLRDLGLKPLVHADTAGAAAMQCQSACSWRMTWAVSPNTLMNCWSFIFSRSMATLQSRTSAPTLSLVIFAVGVGHLVRFVFQDRVVDAVLVDVALDDLLSRVQPVFFGDSHLRVLEEPLSHYVDRPDVGGNPICIEHAAADVDAEVIVAHRF